MSVSISNDPVVSKEDLLIQPRLVNMPWSNITTKRVTLQETNLKHESDIHNWRGERNRIKLREIVADFVERYGEPEL